MTQKVGKVHFTIEARIYNGTNDYTDVDDVKTIGVIVAGAVLVPLAITGVVFTRSKLLLDTFVGKIVNTATGVVISNASKVTISTVRSICTNKTVGTPNMSRSNETGQEFHVPAEWCIDACVNSKGWYMDTDRKFAIRGGPTIYNRLRPFEVICIT
jgi:hypothetical protein